jgi:hypothetical protein
MFFSFRKCKKGKDYANEENCRPMNLTFTSARGLCPEPDEGANREYFPFVPGSRSTRATFWGPAVWTKGEGKSARKFLRYLFGTKVLCRKPYTRYWRREGFLKVTVAAECAEALPWRYSDSPSKKTTKTPSSRPVSSTNPRSTAMCTMPNRSNQLAATNSPSLS